MTFEDRLKGYEIFEKKIKWDVKEAIEHIKEPKHIKILKILVIIIALGVIGFLIYNNFLVSKEFNYFYDIGGEEDAKNPYLTPTDRVSDIQMWENISYRNLTWGVVYFYQELPTGSDKIRVNVKFMNTLPKDYRLSIGIKDKEEWSYTYNLPYQNLDVNQEWTEVTGEFFVDKIYIQDKMASLILTSPYFWETNFDNPIPIDYINITVYKPGMMERMKNGESFIEALKGVTR
jgi:hypothetical protein